MDGLGVARVGWVTTLGPDARQVEYRLEESVGCAADIQTDYRLSEAQAVLEWIGEGLAEVGIRPWEPFGTGQQRAVDPRAKLSAQSLVAAVEAAAAEAGVEPIALFADARLRALWQRLVRGVRQSQDRYRVSVADLAAVAAAAGIDFDAVYTRKELDKEAARDLMDGRDPRTGETLVQLKKAVDPRAKLSAQPLVAAIAAAAAEAGIDPAEIFTDDRRLGEWLRLVRGVAKSQDRYRVPVTVLATVAAAAGIDLDAVYGAEAVAAAREYQDQRIVVGNRGYDLELDMPKSYSVLQAIAPDPLASDLDRIFRECVRETVGAVETWAAWAQRGHHGDGKSAARIDSTGVLGWSMVHYTARPVDGHVPDPHLHVHLNLANMIRGTDGKWSALGAGGRDLHRFAVAANAYLEARVRERTAAELGLVWAVDPKTNAWEIAAIPRGLRDVFSKRHQEVRLAESAVAEGGTVTTEQRKLIAAQTARAKDPAAGIKDLRAAWKLQAAAAGYDMGAVAAAATTRYGPEPETSVEAIAQRIWDVQNGLCAHKKTVSHAEVLGAVANAVHGVTDLADLDRLTDAVLAVPGYAVRLDADLPGTLTAPQRYTQRDIVEAEQAILTAARERMATGAGLVDPDLVQGAIEAFELANGFALSAEQRAVIERLTGAGHGIDAVIGVAGAGKTTIMEALLGAHQAAGHVVAGASTAAIAAHHLQAETRIPSMTIASWLSRIERGPGLRGIDVLVIDEAGMTDDRQLARLIAAAGRSCTQIVGIGDPLQLRAPGVGGSFGDVHALLGGLHLADNRRQQHETEIRALAAWREGKRRALLDAFDERGALHVEEQLDGVWEAMVGTWWSDIQHLTDPHERIAARLLIVGTNADVAIVNHGAQAIRLAEGELDPAAGRDYRIEGGQVLRLHVGDIVAARHNDYDTGVLNGYRGIVESIDDDGTVHVAVREPGSAEPVIKRIGEQYVRTGHMELGYAMTGHRSQGQQAQKTLVSLTGMDAHAAYSAATRHRDRADVWLAAAALEDDATRARLGEPGSDRERLERTVDAYLDYLARPEPDPLALSGLAGARGDLLDHREGPPPSAVEPEPVQAAFPDAAPQPPSPVDEAADQDHVHEPRPEDDPTIGLSR